MAGQKAKGRKPAVQKSRKTMPAPQRRRRPQKTRFKIRLSRQQQLLILALVCCLIGIATKSILFAVVVPYLIWVTGQKRQRRRLSKRIMRL